MTSTTRTYASFQEMAAVILATFVGLLISAPLSATAMQSGNLIASFTIVILGAAAGALIGMRRRKSRLFLYFCMLAIVILAVTISSANQV